MLKILNNLAHLQKPYHELRIRIDLLQIINLLINVSRYHFVFLISKFYSFLYVLLFYDTKIQINIIFTVPFSERLVY